MSKTQVSEFYSFYKFVITPENPYDNIKNLSKSFKLFSVFRRRYPSDFFKLFVEMANVVEATVKTNFRNTQVLVH